MLQNIAPDNRSWFWTEIFGPNVPTLVLVDLQQEYRPGSRALSLPLANDAIARCKDVLAHARRIGMPVAFTRLGLPSAFFNSATKFHSWIDGFTPRGSDFVFERSLPSCYSSHAFSEVMTKSGGNLVIAGFSGDGACLATAVDAFNRGHKVTFLTDASASHTLAGLDCAKAHETITAVISQYARIMRTEHWMSQANSLSY